MSLDTPSTAQHPLQKPVMLVAFSVLFSGILIAVTIVATQLFPEGFSLKNAISGQGVQDDEDAAQRSVPALSIGNDPVLGDRSQAKVAIVEFSDYECPFCKKFHEETHDALVKKYVDTGKAVIVFKDFPLSFHEPMASKEAIAANCVQKLVGDNAYFSYGALLYANTATNGKGMSDAKMTDLATSVGATREAFANCTANNDFKNEIAEDVAEGAKASITGTPAFIIGTLHADGTITEGTKLVGAQPLAAFEKSIEAALRK